MTDFFDVATANARAQAAAVHEGVKIGARDAKAKLDAIFSAYDEAVRRDLEMMPTMLMAAIEAARTTAPQARAHVTEQRGVSMTEYRITGTLEQVLAGIAEKFRTYNPVGYGTRVHELQIVYPKENEYAARMSRSNSCD